eukprot:m.292512 g.292512  ORF g.292512 m.292512 type:complete len:158 (-) comp17826_c0_seq12:3628-4101(-)
MFKSGHHGFSKLSRVVEAMLRGVFNDVIKDTQCPVDVFGVALPAKHGHKEGGHLIEVTIKLSLAITVEHVDETRCFSNNLSKTSVVSMGMLANTCVVLAKLVQHPITLKHPTPVKLPILPCIAPVHLATALPWLPRPNPHRLVVVCSDAQPFPESRS